VGRKMLIFPKDYVKNIQNIIIFIFFKSKVYVIFSNLKSINKLILNIIKIY
jgi:hypothetical protein